MGTSATHTQNGYNVGSEHSNYLGKGGGVQVWFTTKVFQNSKGKNKALQLKSTLLTERCIYLDF